MQINHVLSQWMDHTVGGEGCVMGNLGHRSNSRLKCEKMLQGHHQGVHNIGQLDARYLRREWQYREGDKELSGSLKSHHSCEYWNKIPATLQCYPSPPYPSKHFEHTTFGNTKQTLLWTLLPLSGIISTHHYYPPHLFYPAQHLLTTPPPLLPVFYPY